MYVVQHTLCCSTTQKRSNNTKARQCATAKQVVLVVKERMLLRTLYSTRNVVQQHRSEANSTKARQCATAKQVVLIVKERMLLHTLYSTRNVVQQHRSEANSIKASQCATAKTGCLDRERTHVVRYALTHVVLFNSTKARLSAQKRGSLAIPKNRDFNPCIKKDAVSVYM